MQKWLCPEGWITLSGYQDNLDYPNYDLDTQSITNRPICIKIYSKKRSTWDDAYTTCSQHAGQLLNLDYNFLSMQMGVLSDLTSHITQAGK